MLFYCQFLSNFQGAAALIQMRSLSLKYINEAGERSSGFIYCTGARLLCPGLLIFMRRDFSKENIICLSERCML